MATIQRAIRYVKKGGTARLMNVKQPNIFSELVIDDDTPMVVYSEDGEYDDLTLLTVEEIITTKWTLVDNGRTK